MRDHLDLALSKSHRVHLVHHTVEMTDNSDFPILFDAENTAVIPEIFLSSSFNDC